MRAHRPHGHYENGQGSRRAAILVLLVVLVAGALAPLFVLQHMAEKNTSDGGYQMVAAYAHSVNGDHTYDAQAASALPKLVVTDLGGGREQVAHLSDNRSTCWVTLVESSKAGRPYAGPIDACAKR